MKSLVLKENELKDKFSEIYREEQIKLLEEKWNLLKENDKLFVVEFLKVIYPEKSKLINESKWYNTLGDIAGIFDPTGVIDLINGISYWRQGDHLFAILSWVSVIPYLGDFIAKPVVGLFRAGEIVGTAFKEAMIAADAAKMASTAKNSSVLRNFLVKAPEWGGKLIEMLKKFINKFPLIRRVIPLIENYIKLFKTAATETKVVSTAGKASKEAEMVFRGFRDFGSVKNNWFKYMRSNAPLWEKLNAGSFRVFGGNPATRSLMRRSKWYLGLLDSLGILDTKTSPEELENKVQNFEQKLDDYNKSDEAKSNIQQDMTSQEETTSDIPAPPTEKSTSQTSNDPISTLVSLFMPGGKLV